MEDILHAIAYLHSLSIVQLISQLQTFEKKERRLVYKFK